MSERAMVWYGVLGAVLLGLAIGVWCLVVLARRRRPLERAVRKAMRQAELAESLGRKLEAVAQRAETLANGVEPVVAKASDQVGRFKSRG